MNNEKNKSKKSPTLLQDIVALTKITAVATIVTVIGVGGTISMIYIASKFLSIPLPEYIIDNKTVNIYHGEYNFMRIKSNDTTYNLTQLVEGPDVVYANMEVRGKQIREWTVNPKDKPFLSEFTKQYWYYSDKIDSITHKQ